MYKMRLTESPNCDCNMDRETTEHYLLDCIDFESERQVMLNKIGKTWMENKKWGSLNINSEMLLGPNFSEKVTRIEDDTIKDALFEFLLSTGKKL